MADKSEKWLSEWSRTIGSSRAAAVAGVDDAFGVTPQQVFNEMVGLVPLPDLSQNPDVRRGTLYEPIARMRLGEELQVEIKPHDQDMFLYNSALPFAHCLPDGWIEKVSVELKVPRPRTWRKMQLSGINDCYYVQAQHTLAVLGTEFIHFAAMDPVTLEILYVKVARDEAVIGRLIEREKIFAERVEELSSPPVEALALEQREPGKLKILTGDEALGAALRLLEADELSKEAEELLKQRKRELCAVAEDADCFEVPGVVRCYNKVRDGRTTFDYKSAIAQDATLKKYLKIGKPYTEFRHYPMGGTR